MTPGEHSKTDLRRGRIRPQSQDRDHATSAEEEAFLFEAGPVEQAAGGKEEREGKNAVVVRARKQA